MGLARPQFGIELELFDEDDTSLAEMALEIFQAHEVTSHGHIHAYHCRCSQCDYHRQEGLMAAQRDSTVGVEFISRILQASQSDVRQVRRLVKAYTEVQGATGWIPDGHNPNGNHIHVGWPGTVQPIERARATSYLRSLIACGTDAWSDIGNGECLSGTVRSYNDRPCPSSHYSDESYNPADMALGVSLSRDENLDGWGLGGGNWISDRGGYNTVEFRLWNTPAEPSRLLVHPAISCAMVHAGLRWAEIDRFDNALKIYRWVEKNWDLAMRQVGQIVRDIWPDGASASAASELLAEATN